MRLLSRDILDREWKRFDAAVSDTPDIDHFCSSTAWVVSSWQAMHENMASAVYEFDGGFLAFGKAQHPDGFSYLQPLEASWGLGSPIVGTDVEACVQALALLPTRQPDCALLLLTGLHRDSLLFRRICAVLGQDLGWQMALGESTRRHIANLNGGAQSFLSRRSRNFRRGLHKSEQRAKKQGIIFDGVCQGPINTEQSAVRMGNIQEWHQRIVDVESRSWKGQDGVGIDQGSFGDFYKVMLPRLLRSGALRLLFMRDNGRDVGYVLGALSGDTYRGLQFSYDQEYVDLSLGNLGQWQQIQWLCDEGVAQYDLGTDMPYKTRWADHSFTTETVLCRLQP